MPFLVSDAEKTSIQFAAATYTASESPGEIGAVTGSQPVTLVKSGSMSGATCSEISKA